MFNSIALLLKLVLLAVVVVGAVVVVTYVTSPATTAPAANLNSSNNASVQALKATALYQQLSTARQLSLSTLVQSQNSSQNYNATYSGTVSYKGSISGIAIPLSFPISVQNQRFANDSRIQVALRNVPLISNVNFSIIKLGHTLYTCSPNSLFSKNITYSCDSQQDDSNSTLGIFSLASSGLNVTINNVYPSQFGTTPCVFMNSSFVLPHGKSNAFLGSLASIGGTSSSSNSSTSGTLASCIDPSTNLPLTLDLSIQMKETNSTTSLGISMTQSSNNNIVSDAAIMQLPGTVSNSG